MDVVVTGVDPETSARLREAVQPLIDKARRGAYHTRRRARRAHDRAKRRFGSMVAAAPKMSETVELDAGGKVTTAQPFGLVTSIVAIPGQADCVSITFSCSTPR